MSAAQVGQLLGALGTSHILAFFLVLARVGPLFVLAPLFSSSYLPPQVRIVLAIGLAIGMTGIADHGQHIPGSPLALAGLVLEQFLVGGALAFAVAAMFAAIQSAGSILDAAAGFSFGAMLNPLTGTQDAILTQLYTLVGTAIFIAALEIAAPVVLAVLVTDIAFGMLSRVVPQLNVYAVGFPVKVGVALIAVTVSLPFVGGFIGGQLPGSIGGALRELAAF